MPGGLRAAELLLAADADAAACMQLGCCLRQSSACQRTLRLGVRDLDRSRSSGGGQDAQQQAQTHRRC